MIVQCYAMVSSPPEGYSETLLLDLEAVALDQLWLDSVGGPSSISSFERLFPGGQDS